MLKRFLYILHVVLLLAGVGLLIWPVYVTAESTVVQTAAPPPVEADKPPQPGSRVGRISIPRLKMSWIVLEGTGRRTLDRSVGHIELTGLPGSPGNVGIAGHRNTHFRKLKNIRRGDKITLTTPKGQFTYEVEWTRVFSPKDTQVLHPSHGPAVTLVTCYPFNYVGRAPKRFIVRALPDETTRAKLDHGYVAPKSAD